MSRHALDDHRMGSQTHRMHQSSESQTTVKVASAKENNTSTDVSNWLYNVWKLTITFAWLRFNENCYCHAKFFTTMCRQCKRVPVKCIERASLPLLRSGRDLCGSHGRKYKTSDVGRHEWFSNWASELLGSSLGAFGRTAGQNKISAVGRQEWI